MKTGFTCGTFDLLHAGHLLMLEEASQQCDYLIVGLHNDPSLERKHKALPIQSIVERMIQLKAVKYVDEIWVYNSEQDLLDLLKVLPVSIRILGEEYKNQDFTGRGICEQRGIELYYNGRQHNFSSTELRKRIAAQ